MVLLVPSLNVLQNNGVYFREFVSLFVRVHVRAVGWLGWCRQIGKHVRVQRSGRGLPAGHVLRRGGGPRSKGCASCDLQGCLLRCVPFVYFTAVFLWLENSEATLSYKDIGLLFVSRGSIIVLESLL